jgi:hypothetical protein
MLELSKKGIFLTEVDQSRFFFTMFSKTITAFLLKTKKIEKSIFQMINETSNILRQERIQKQVKNLEAFCNQIRELQKQNQLVKKENTLYKQKFKLIERLLQSQLEEITVLNRNFVRWEHHRQVNRKLGSLEESIALIVSDNNTNGNKCRHNGALIDTMKNVKIKEEPLPCEMSAKQRKILHRGI